MYILKASNVYNTILGTFNDAESAGAALSAMLDAANDMGWVFYKGIEYHVPSEIALTVQEEVAFFPELLETPEDGWEL